MISKESVVALSRHQHRGTEENQERPHVSITGVPAEIRTEHLQNIYAYLLEWLAQISVVRVNVRSDSNTNVWRDNRNNYEPQKAYRSVEVWEKRNV
jgi:hypothetical protein